MSKLRFVAVGFVSVGMLLLMVGGGYLYTDYANREGGWVELQYSSGQLTDDERGEIHARWHDRSLGYKAFSFGAVGSALVCAGSLTLLITRNPKSRAV